MATRHISLELLQLLVTIYECCRGAIVLFFALCSFQLFFLLLRPGYRHRADFAAYIKRTRYRAAYNDSLAGSSWPAPSICPAMGTLELLLGRTVISFLGYDELIWLWCCAEHNVLIVFGPPKVGEWIGCLDAWGGFDVMDTPQRLSGDSLSAWLWNLRHVVRDTGTRAGSVGQCIGTATGLYNELKMKNEKQEKPRVAKKREECFESGRSTEKARNVASKAQRGCRGGKC